MKLSQCPAFDVTVDGYVGKVELVLASKVASYLCLPSPTRFINHPEITTYDLRLLVSTWQSLLKSLTWFL